METQTPVRISANSPPTEGGGQNLSGKTESYPYCTLVAQATLVRLPTRDVQQSFLSSSVPGLVISELRPGPSSRPPMPTTDCVEDTELIDSIIAACHKLSTTKLYHYKRRRFLFYAADKGFDPINPPLTWIFQYLLHLKRSGLTLSSLHVHLSTIVAHQPPMSPASLFFRHPHLKLFLQSL
ncbi:hypothetical protein JRQ81_002941, partial [Phrynocephalus forsythii]